MHTFHQDGAVGINNMLLKKLKNHKFKFKNITIIQICMFLNSIFVKIKYFHLAGLGADDWLHIVVLTNFDLQLCEKQNKG